MENNESSSELQPTGWSDDSIAPSSSNRGFYDTAGFGERTDQKAETDQATTVQDSEDSENPGDGDNPTNDGDNPIVDGNTTVDDSWAAPANDYGYSDPGQYMPPPPIVDPNAPRRLYRTDGPIGGVASGLAEYFTVDPVLVRLILVAATIISFPVMPFAYVAAWMIIPRRDPAPVPPIMTTPTPGEPIPGEPAPKTDAVSTPVDCVRGR